MKILFLCGSLEHGRDGVGDYTRRLAGEIIRQGHDASIIAFNDRHIDTIIAERQLSNETEIAVLRLPSVLLNRKKDASAKRFIDTFNPEWLSLQFVPYSYNKRGLAWNVFLFCRKIKKRKIRFCVTVHEPFVRFDDSKNPIRMIITLLQMFILKKILSESSVVMTSIARYKKQLDKYHNNIIINRIPPNILPVWVDSQILNHKKKEFCDKLRVSKLIVIFGMRNVDNMVKAVGNINNENMQKIGIVIVGNGQEKKYKNDFVYYTGLLDENNVSYHLQLADLFVLPEQVYKNNRGGATFKSGSLAAACATPLPILTSKGDMTETPPLIHGKNIWFTDFNNEKQLQQDIIQLLNDSSLLNKLKKGSLEIYNNCFEWSMITNKYIAMFQLGNE